MANSVKFIQISRDNYSDYSAAISQALLNYPGSIIFGQYINNGKTVQELYANGMQYDLGGVDISGIAGNLVKINSTGDGIIDSEISVDDIVTSIKTINGTDMKGTGNIQAGITFSDITPINKTEISTLDILRARILSHNTGTGEKVPENYTFDQFIKDLFIKVNPEQTSTAEVLPVITLSQSTSQDASYVLEVGDTTQKTLSCTYSKGVYTDGTLRTHTVTNGESQDSYYTINAGCSTDEKDYNIKNSSSVTVSTNQSYTTSVSGQFSYQDGNLSKPSQIQKTIGTFTLEQAYDASTTWRTCKTSYGNALYTENPILAGTTISAPSKSLELTMNADFYRFWGSTEQDLKNHYSLGAKSDFYQVLTNGYVFLYPSNKTVNISWTTMSEWDSHPSTDDYTTRTVYVYLPSQHNPSWSDTVPQSGKYALYTLYTLTTAPVGKTCKISIS